MPEARATVQDHRLPVLGGRAAGARNGVVRPAVARAARTRGPLRDSHGRAIRDLRLSITDRCNFRCVYCLEPDEAFQPPSSLMSVSEIERVARMCVRLGVRRVRITGGEPTVHPRLDEIMARLAALAPADLSMTTNGDLVTEEAAGRWKRLGLRRLTLSLDTLRPERFSAITRSASSPQRVLRAIRAATGAGLDPVRVNAVIIRGQNDDEVADLAGLAREMDVEVRLIEYMPLDAGHAWDRSLVVTADEMREQIEAHHRLEPMGRATKSGTALNYRFADGAPGGVGLIAPVSRPFCGACSRLRITADAKVRPCLFSRTEYDLRSLLRNGASDETIGAAIADAVWNKQAGHGISSPDFVQPERTMSAIGG